MMELWIETRDRHSNLSNKFLPMQVFCINILQLTRTLGHQMKPSHFTNKHIFIDILLKNFCCVQVLLSIPPEKFYTRTANDDLRPVPGFQFLKQLKSVEKVKCQKLLIIFSFSWSFQPIWFPYSCSTRVTQYVET